MGGQLRVKGKNKWLLRVFDCRDANGKRHYIYETFHGGKKAAEKRLMEIANSRNQGTYVRPTKDTLNDYLDQWLETCVKPRVQRRTFDDYQSLFSRYVREPLGSRKLSQLRPTDVQDLYRAMQKRGLSARVVRSEKR